MEHNVVFAHLDVLTEDIKKASLELVFQLWSVCGTLYRKGRI